MNYIPWIAFSLEQYLTLLEVFPALSKPDHIRVYEPFWWEEKKLWKEPNPSLQHMRLQAKGILPICGALPTIISNDYGKLINSAN